MISGSDGTRPGWTDRQRAMLREMGLRGLLLPGVDRPADGGAPSPAPATAGSRSGQHPDPEPAPMRSPPTAQVSTAPEPIEQPSTAAAPTSTGEALSSRARDVAALDWPALQASVTACQACRLCEGRTQTVFGTGSPQAQWMVVGEAPGEEEDRRGEPFVGKSGQLLDAMLASLGLSRAVDAPPPQAVYIANAVKCRPPGNRNPQPDELARCEAFLLRQVALLRPRLILAMGRFAVQSLLRSDEPIGRLRGRAHHYQGVPLVVTYHPAYLLRSPQEKARAWDDLCRARSVFDSHDPAPREGSGVHPGPLLGPAPGSAD